MLSHIDRFGACLPPWATLCRNRPGSVGLDVVGLTGVEPVPPFGDSHLKAARLPFHHNPIHWPPQGHQGGEDRNRTCGTLITSAAFPRRYMAANA